MKRLLLLAALLLGGCQTVPARTTVQAHAATVAWQASLYVQIDR